MRFVVWMLTAITAISSVTVVGDESVDLPWGARLVKFDLGKGGWGPPPAPVFTEVATDGLAAELGFCHGDALVKAGTVRHPSLSQLSEQLNSLNTPEDAVEVVIRECPAAKHKEDLRLIMTNLWSSAKTKRINRSQFTSALKNLEERKKAWRAEVEKAAREPVRLRLLDGTIISHEQVENHNANVKRKGASKVLELSSEGNPFLATDMQLTAEVMGDLVAAMKNNDTERVKKVMHVVTANGLAGRVRNTLASTGVDELYHVLSGNRVLTGGEVWEEAAYIYTRAR